MSNKEEWGQHHCLNHGTHNFVVGYGVAHCVVCAQERIAELEAERDALKTEIAQLQREAGMSEEEIAEYRA